MFQIASRVAEPPSTSPPRSRGEVSQTTADRCRELFAAGLRQRTIAERLGISLHTVKTALKRAAPGVFDPMKVERLAVRCPGCGGKVVMPCRLCAMGGNAATGKVE